MKKLFLLAVISLLSLAFALDPIHTSDSLRDSADKANRRTALRCLNNATNYFADKNWEAVVSQVSLGIAYDDSISDLWYILAAADMALGYTRQQLAPMLEKSLNLNNWVNYNRDNARLMYADILSDTGNLSQALEILDSKPMLYSSDAEYIRIKVYYRMGDGVSVSKARNKIDGARKIYSSDTRFPLIFFKHESPDSMDPDVKRLSSYFISRIAQYAEAAPDKDAELEIYAASFAQGETKIHLLKSFSARGLSHPLYAREALAAGILGEQDSFEYIEKFADNEIDYDILVSFISMLKDSDVLSYAREYFTAFGGTILRDTDDDGLLNLKAKFMRGRCSQVSYDKNQDGQDEWVVKCDFGNPVSGSLYGRNMDFTWSSFPYLGSVAFNMDNTQAMARETFSIVGESLKWTPLQMGKENFISKKLKMEFFFPEISETSSELTNNMLLDCASDFEIESNRENGGRIHFVLLNGNVQTSLYYDAQNRLYAQAQFENNLPVLRVVDADSDGLFETTEFYAVDEKGDMEVHSLSDERTVMKNLYGVPSDASEFYLKMIQIDSNADTVPDFTEEYLPHGGRITSWDVDGSGNWNVRHVIYPKSQNGSVKEESMFYSPVKNQLVCVECVNGVPQSVKNGDFILNVIKCRDYDFYWICSGNTVVDDDKLSDFSKKIRNFINHSVTQGVSSIVDDETYRALFVRVGNVNYAMLIDREVDPDNFVTNGNIE